MILDIRMLSCFLVICPFLLSNLSMVSAFEISTTDEGMYFLDKNGEKNGIVTDDLSGLQHRVIKKGTGCYHPTIHSEVVIDYEGRTLDGTVFDSSFDKEEPSLFSLTDEHVIRGWGEILSKMVVGDKFEVFISSELAYGSSGNPHLHIGAGEVLVYVIELVEIIGFTQTALYCTVINDGGREYGSKDCNKQEEEYIMEASNWNLDDLVMEQRLLVKAEPVKGSTGLELDSKHWILRRFHILKQLRIIKTEKDEF